MNRLLELREVEKIYGDDVILKNASFLLDSGTVVAIVGHSGGGKTTLLSIMGLLQQASGGKVAVDGQDIAGLPPQKLAQLRSRYFGFVFQRARLIHSLNALENVIAPAWFIRQGQDVEERAKELLERFGLSHRLYHKPQELSLGQLRRVSLARALLLKPPILLADEPTNDLDPALADEVAQSLLAARADGAGVVIVTHDDTLAAQADTIFCLANGVLHPVA